MDYKYLIILIISIILISACSQKQIQKEADNMRLTSPAFQEGQFIPSRFTCDEEDVSPHLIISEVPKNAKSLALIMDDPDAPMGTFVHWVVWNIPPEKQEILENEDLPNQGTTDFKRQGYGGPCPPSGTHRYFFKLFALDIVLDLKDGSAKKDLENAMKGHIIDTAQLLGLYKRS